MSSHRVKTRFAPSPTGHMHLGNARTALFNALLSCARQGVFLLRIEDTDAQRSLPEYQKALEEDLHWLGIVWQEGAEVGGDNGPYEQSQRQSIYQSFYTQLENAGQAYACFCSERELKLSRKTQLSGGQAPRYSGKCRNLNPREIEAKQQAGIQPTLRFRVPDDQRIEFTDLVRGAQVHESRDIGDFIIRRGDGTPAFFFSNAIDDALMRVTCVLRGEDHLTNTPRQMLLLKALNLACPEYGHISLIVGQDGAPLSKRHGSQSIRDLRAKGYLSLALVNYLARLGHTYPNEDGLMSMQDLAKHFSSARLGHAPAHYDEVQLIHWQQMAIAAMSEEALWEWMCDYRAEGAGVEDFVPEHQTLEFVQAIRHNITLPRDAFIWAGNLYTESECYDEEAKKVIREAGVDFFKATLDCLNEDVENFGIYAKAVGKMASVKGKSLFMPIRAALTGEKHFPDSQSVWRHGPEMSQIWKLLGPKRMRRRLEYATLQLNN